MPLVAASMRTATLLGRRAHTLRAGTTSFTVVPDLGLLGTSLRVGRREYLDLADGPLRVLGGHTAGLPLLAPWANRIGGDSYRVGRRTVELADAPGLHREGHGLPIHGTMIGRPGWVADRVSAGGGEARLSAMFDSGADPEVMASFPFPHRLRVTFRLRPAELAVTTSLAATGRVRVPVSFGWHPYFRLPGEELGDLRVHLPAVDRLDLDERMLPTAPAVSEPSSLRPLCPEGHDDAFRFRGRARTLALVGRRRSVTVSLGAGYPFGQVYAPPGSPVVALEPMTAATDSLRHGTTPMVAPGSSFSARFRISLS